MAPPLLYHRYQPMPTTMEQQTLIPQDVPMLAPYPMANYGHRPMVQMAPPPTMDLHALRAQRLSEQVLAEDMPEMELYRRRYHTRDRFTVPSYLRERSEQQSREAAGEASRRRDVAATESHRRRNVKAVASNFKPNLSDESQGQHASGIFTRSEKEHQQFREESKSRVAKNYDTSDSTADDDVEGLVREWTNFYDQDRGVFEVRQSSEP